MPALGDHGHDLVAVDDLALLVDDHHPVGVAVERDADVGAQLAHLVAERLRRGRAALVVDVVAVGLDADLDHLGAQLPQRVGRHLVAGAVGAIDDDAQAVEADVARQRALGELDVALLRALDALGAADPVGGRQQVRGRRLHQRLDLALGLVGELVAVGVEQLDAVVGVGIVGGRDHHAEVGAQRAGEHGDRRRRHRAEQEHVHADRREARHQRRFDHVAGEPRVLADDDAMPVGAVGEQLARGHADLERDLRGHGRGCWPARECHRCRNTAATCVPSSLFLPRQPAAACGGGRVRSDRRCHYAAATRPSIKSCKQRLHQLRGHQTARAATPRVLSTSRRVAGLRRQRSPSRRSILPAMHRPQIWPRSAGRVMSASIPVSTSAAP